MAAREENGVESNYLPDIPADCGQVYYPFSRRCESEPIGLSGFKGFPGKAK